MVNSNVEQYHCQVLGYMKVLPCVIKWHAPGASKSFEFKNEELVTEVKIVNA